MTSDAEATRNGSWACGTSKGESILDGISGNEMLANSRISQIKGYEESVLSIYGRRGREGRNIAGEMIMMKGMFKSIFQPSSILLRQWCTTVYGGSLW